MFFCQFRVLAKLDVQPFGISVCEESDHVIVTCSTPLRHAVPFLARSSRLLVYHGTTHELQHTIMLDNSYDVPRHAIAVGNWYAVCHGWNKPGKVRGNFAVFFCHNLFPPSVLWHCFLGVRKDKLIYNTNSSRCSFGGLSTAWMISREIDRLSKIDSISINGSGKLMVK